MKFMMNGALTLGTRDGATIEMAQEAARRTSSCLGLLRSKLPTPGGWYNPHWHYEHEPETRAALDLIFSDHFSRHEPGIFGRCATCCSRAATTTCTSQTCAPISSRREIGCSLPRRGRVGT